MIICICYSHKVSLEKVSGGGGRLRLHLRARMHRHPWHVGHVGDVPLVHEQVGQAGGWSWEASSRSCQEREGRMGVVEVGGGRPGGEEGGVGAAWGRSGGGEVSTVHIKAGILLFPFCSSVLEPDLHLRLRQVQRQGEVESFTHGEVASRLELVLKTHQLLVCEGCTCTSWLSTSVPSFPFPVMIVGVGSIRRRW